MRQRLYPLYGIAVAGLAGLLVLAGCSKKSVSATTEGMEYSTAPVAEVVKPPPVPAEVAKAAPPEATKRELLDVYFAFDKWALTAEGKKHLTQSAEALKQAPTVKLLIEGHCDERGTHEYNLVLGEKRAKVAQQFLLDLGVKNPISVTSYGKEKPVCTEHGESCYWKNRRAHLVVQEGK